MNRFFFLKTAQKNQFTIHISIINVDSLQRGRSDARPGLPQQRVLQRARGGAAALHDPLAVRDQVRQVRRGRRRRRQGRNLISDHYH